MSKQYLYIIDTAKPYNGSVENIMDFVPQDQVNDTKVHYSSETFAEYNKRKGGALSALNFETFYTKYYKPFLDDMQGPFVETTSEKFDDGLNCLPPKKWTRSGKNQFFFVGECYTDTLYRCYVYVGGKYYTALRSILTPAEDIFNLKNVNDNASN